MTSVALFLSEGFREQGLFSERYGHPDGHLFEPASGGGAGSVRGALPHSAKTRNRGEQLTVEAAIETMVERIVQGFRPLRVILFWFSRKRYGNARQRRGSPGRP